MNLSQEELYGPLLTNEQQYRAELFALCIDASTLTPNQQDALISRARAGDKQAHEALITCLLPRVERFARRYALTYGWDSSHIEHAELIGVGNHALVESFPKALTKTKPLAYLTATAYGEMRKWTRRYHSLVARPETIGASVPHVTSLDAPLFPDEETTLLDFITSPHEARPDTQSYQELDQAIGALPEPYQSLIIQFHGLSDTPELDIKDLATKKERNRFMKQRERAYARLRVLLADSPWGKGQPESRGVASQSHQVVLSQDRHDRLMHAYEQLQLQQQREKITCTRLAQVACVATAYASAFLVRMGHSLKRGQAHLPEQQATREMERKQKLLNAYLTLQEQGHTITTTLLQKTAGVGTAATCAFLREYRSSQPHTRASINFLSLND